MAHVDISNIETDTTSIISPRDTNKLLETNGVFPEGRGSLWLERIAKKVVGRQKVHFFPLSYFPDKMYIKQMIDHYCLMRPFSFYGRCRSH